MATDAIGRCGQDRCDPVWIGRWGMGGRFGQASKGFDGSGVDWQVWQGQVRNGDESMGVDGQAR